MLIQLPDLRVPPMKRQIHFCNYVARTVKDGWTPFPSWILACKFCSPRFGTVDCFPTCTVILSLNMAIRSTMNLSVTLSGERYSALKSGLLSSLLFSGLGVFDGCLESVILWSGVSPTGGMIMCFPINEVNILLLQKAVLILFLLSFFFNRFFSCFCPTFDQLFDMLCTSWFDSCHTKDICQRVTVLRWLKDLLFSLSLRSLHHPLLIGSFVSEFWRRSWSSCNTIYYTHADAVCTMLTPGNKHHSAVHFHCLVLFWPQLPFWFSWSYSQRAVVDITQPFIFTASCFSDLNCLFDFLEATLRELPYFTVCFVLLMVNNAKWTDSLLLLSRSPGRIQR